VHQYVIKLRGHTASSYENEGIDRVKRGVFKGKDIILSKDGMVFFEQFFHGSTTCLRLNG
jgi:hypothetical protein